MFRIHVGKTTRANIERTRHTPNSGRSVGVCRGHSTMADSPPWILTGELSENTKYINKQFSQLKTKILCNILYTIKCLRPRREIKLLRDCTEKGDG